MGLEAERLGKRRIPPKDPRRKKKKKKQDSPGSLKVKTLLGPGPWEKQGYTDVQCADALGKENSFSPQHPQACT